MSTAESINIFKIWSLKNITDLNSRKYSGSNQARQKNIDHPPVGREIPACASFGVAFQDGFFKD
jgi:hypothetical protein